MKNALVQLLIEPTCILDCVAIYEIRQELIRSFFTLSVDITRVIFTKHCSICIYNRAIIVLISRNPGPSLYLRGLAPCCLDWGAETLQL